MSDKQVLLKFVAAPGKGKSTLIELINYLLYEHTNVGVLIYDNVNHELLVDLPNSNGIPDHSLLKHLPSKEVSAHPPRVLEKK